MIGSHSVIESPEPVSRVSPPMVTMREDDERDGRAARIPTARRCAGKYPVRVASAVRHGVLIIAR